MENENTYISLSRLTGSREILEKNSFYMLLKAAIRITEEFDTFSKTGKFIMSVSEDRILVNPADCSVQIAEGAFEVQEGRYRFTAPETLDGVEEESEYGSRYTLAVLLYHLLVQSFPFEGRLWLQVKESDSAACEAYYRNSPPFVFSGKTDKNRPKLGLQNNAIAYWTIYPVFFKQAFITTFDGGERLTFSAWREILSHMRSCITLCEQCGAEIFCDAEGENTCWRCNAKASPLKLHLVENGLVKVKLPLLPGTEYAGGKNSFEVVVRGARWGVKNTSEGVWKWVKSNGAVTEIEKNEAVPVTRGMEIRFRSGSKLLLAKAEEESKA